MFVPGDVVEVAVACVDVDVTPDGMPPVPLPFTAAKTRYANNATRIVALAILQDLLMTCILAFFQP